MDKKKEKREIKINLSKKSRQLLKIGSKKEDKLLKKRLIKYLKKINKI